MPQKYGYLANAVEVETKPCLVCDDPAPRFSWTDLNGEGYCLQCGTSYQLANGKLDEGESYPRCNVRPEWIPTLRRFWSETHGLNGCGTYMLPRDYPDQLAGRIALKEWCERFEKADETLPIKVEP